MGVVLLVGLLVTSISLFVGGVGVMNIMFVSGHRANARDRDPQGDRCEAPKHPDAVHASRSAMICLFGGLMGICLAWLVTYGLIASRR